jgi:HEAT repeat protein
MNQYLGAWSDFSRIDRPLFPLTLQSIRSARVQDPEPVVLVNAAIALGKIGDAAAVPALIDILNNDAPFVQGAAAESLGAIRDLAALPALRRALDHPESDVR